MCGNRRVLFDNKTKDEFKKDKQLEQLLFLVNEVVKNNGGKPYTDEIFAELKVRFFEQTYLWLCLSKVLKVTKSYFFAERS